ncbi:DUF2523 family protein [Aeromonas dhakensis]|uniref:DUF2523 family protein n=1 Tax=Aeromonas dhakensis TaxID=196024 RepID=UPI001CF02EE6|nr:DUF2523 family protein [Aeromonas dhakensis]MDD9309524.1 DUF2523 domain-containing protein [Aeromonas hydrophila]UCM55381.1 DUF2523 domain-containing protein [Aeromonas dhakensis]WPS57718.1 DUF2523 family protein [Aeromonas dhakensis]WRT70981.1 DUF2523 family protein [Aeromonas dhakensis]CAD7491305.1 hypothetical protein KBAD45_20680 [Aeromonas dhakensis]
MWAALTSTVIGSILARALLALGVGIVSMIGFSELLTLAMTRIQNLFGGIPADLLALMGFMHMDVPISAWFAGQAAALALSAATRFLPK